MLKLKYQRNQNGRIKIKRAIKVLLFRQYQDAKVHGCSSRIFVGFVIHICVFGNLKTAMVSTQARTIYVFYR
jgi:hypothetical protein